MSRTTTNRRLALTILALTAGALALNGTDALAISRKKLKKRLASILKADAPMGVRRKNPAVILPFVLENNRKKLVTIQVQYGYDHDDDGIIADGTDPALPSEYIDAAQNRDDTRDTSKRHRPLRYRAGIPPGVGHAYSWNAALDLPGTLADAQGRLLTTDQGRPIPDPNQPEDFLRQTGETGVRYRLRSTAGHGRRKVASDWVYSDRFTINNNALPSTSMFSVVEGDVVTIDWIAFDADSEDANGNGVLDILAGEDADQDGDLDRSFVSIAFDFHRLEVGEDPSAMTQAELDRLQWIECTRSDDQGDSNVGVESTPLGTPHVFAWDYLQDPTAPGDRVILRARGFDGNEHGLTDYWLDAISLGDRPE